MMVLESCLAMLSCLNKEYRRGVSAHRRDPRVEDQHGGCVVTYLNHLGSAHQDVQDPVAEGGV
jgi:hypothetical protein